MNDSIKPEAQHKLTSEIASSLKLFLLGNFFWALPGVIPTMEPLYGFTSIFYEWVAWPANIVAVVLFFLSARRISKALKTS